jgi:hypothetical protein
MTSAQRIYDPVNDPAGMTSYYGVSTATNRLNGYPYDAAGNLTFRGTFDALNRVTSTSVLVPV